MRANVIGRVMDVSRGLRYEAVKNTQQILRDALFVSENGQSTRRVPGQEVTDAVVH